MQNESPTAQETGISDVTYDVMNLLTNKLEGISAIDVYLEDAEDANDQEVTSFLNQLRQQDTQSVHKLRGMLSKRLQSGK